MRSREEMFRPGMPHFLKNAKINKISIASAMVFMIFSGNDLSQGEEAVRDYTGERIRYLVKPAGASEYTNLGTVDYKGAKAQLLSLKSKILFVEVSEKITFDPESLLPYKTERVTTGLWSKEFRSEEYDQEKFTVVVKKYAGAKLVKEKMIRSDRPIRNMNLLLFSMRKVPDLKIGWHFAAKILDELELLPLDLRVVSMDDITVPAGKFQATHFKSTPDKFEVWIRKGDPRIPLKMKIKGIVNCTILTKEYYPRDEGQV